ncbi:DUF4192 family protein [Arthrobacter cryoconiti]|uniref:DUF4192 family protein n=1 Tax=Arthrobacter cryoconiti TaxID=748907 RepID=A0ABV8R3X0_9MICC|nr:DUF4192 family protein [Arthrobacter cryoconiti]MCC9069065.1 DUF4192 domain-containing protein [Arthrobacter cryoconiti]
MENIDKIKVSSGEDLLAFIPHIIGYWPENSVVCIGMLGKTLRATIRLDYPPGSAVDTERFSTLVAGQLSADRQADGALIAFFGSSDWNNPEHFVHQKLYDALTQALASHGMPVRDAWYVGKEHWRSIDCNNPECCPWPGRTNTKITASFVNAELIYRGSSVAGNPRERVPELIAVRDANFSQRVADSAVMFAKNLQGHGMAENQLSATLAVWERVLARWPEPPGSSVSGFLMACLEESSVRDTVLASIASTPQQALAGATGSGCVLANITQVRVPREGDSGGQGDGKIVDIFDASDIENNAAIAYFNAILLGGQLRGRRADRSAELAADRPGRGSAAVLGALHDWFKAGPCAVHAWLDPVVQRPR